MALSQGLYYTFNNEKCIIIDHYPNNTYRIKTFDREFIVLEEHLEEWIDPRIFELAKQNDSLKDKVFEMNKIIQYFKIIVEYVNKTDS